VCSSVIDGQTPGTCLIPEEEPEPEPEPVPIVKPIQPKPPVVQQFSSAPKTPAAPEGDDDESDDDDQGFVENPAGTIGIPMPPTPPQPSLINSAKSAFTHALDVTFIKPWKMIFCWLGKC